jgi:hypothetical protein
MINSNCVDLLLKNYLTFLLDNFFFNTNLTIYYNLNDIKNFYIFYKNWKKLKNLLKLKKEKVFYNKLYKILYKINLVYKATKLNSLELTLLDLHNKNLFLFLPYFLEIKVIFKHKK